MELSSRIQDLARERLCIVGVGNEMRNDDAVGLYITDAIADELREDGVAVIRAEDIVESYVYTIAGLDCKNVIFVDAALADAEPGTVLFGRLDELEELTGGLSTHRMSLRISDRILREHDKKSYLLGIVARDVDFGTTISDEVRKSADIIKDLLVKSVTCTCKGVCQ